MYYFDMETDPCMNTGNSMYMYDTKLYEPDILHDTKSSSYGMLEIHKTIK